MATDSTSHAGRDVAAYVLPMLAFAGISLVGQDWPAWYAKSYIVKTAVTAILLFAFWRSYTKISWRFWWLGAIVGAVGLVQWIGVEQLAGNYPRLTHPRPFDPFASITCLPCLWTFIAVRWAGATLVVPLMEELFWRDFCWRSVVAGQDFKDADVGEWDARALAMVTALFAVSHGMWLTAIVYGLLLAGLLIYTRSLGACIVAHATTNFLLGAYVLYTHQWAFW